jgi:hypothetical protein
MQSRRGFLTALAGAAATVASGDLGKLSDALAAKPTPAELAARLQPVFSQMLDHGYFIAPYIPLQAVATFELKQPAEFIVIDFVVKDHDTPP